MSSSGPIRQQLGPALRNMRNHMGRAQTAAGGDVTNATIGGLRATYTQLTRSIQRIDELNDRWQFHLASLQGAALQAEEQIYESFPPPGPGAQNNEEENEDEEDEAAEPAWAHFMSIAEDAREIQILAEIVISDFDRDQAQQAQQNQPQQQPNNARARAAERTSVARRENPSTQFDLRLPELKIDRFSGDPKKWRTFWQLFSANIDRRQMENVRKMSYLLHYLDGPPKDLVAGYMITDDNYTKVVTLLQSRYGNDRVIQETLEAELINLPRPNDNPHSMRTFVDSIERVCRQLEALGQDEDSPFIATTIKSKLPTPIVTKLVERERARAAMKPGTPWDLSEIRHALNDIVETMEEVQRCSKSLQKDKSNSDNPQNKQHNHPHKKGNYEQGRSFAAKTMEPRECSLCKEGNHWPTECKKYSTPQARKKRLDEQERCFLCLKEKHNLSDCSSTKKCKHCGGKHHHIVCFKSDKKGDSKGKGKQAKSSNPKNDSSNQQQSHQKHVGSTTISTNMMSQNNLALPPTDDSMVIHANSDALPDNIIKSTSASAFDYLRKKSKALLSSCRIMVGAANSNRIIPTYLLFDDASDLNYITEELANKLRPPKISTENVEIHGFGGSSQKVLRFQSPTFAVELKREDGEWQKMELNWTKEITTAFEMTLWTGDIPDNGDQLGDDQLKESIKIVNEKPGILIGTRRHWHYIKNSQQIGSDVFLIHTIFGPALGGELEWGHESPTQSIHTITTINSSNVDQMPSTNYIQEFWNLENIGIMGEITQNDDKLAIEQLQKSITRDLDGRYSVGWIWREPREFLPCNFRMAMSRCASTIGSLKKSSGLLEKYNEVFMDYLKKGIIEVAKKGSGIGEHFLPHHAVVTKKVRPVFDASAHIKGYNSLNNCLLRGPVLLPELIGLLLRFRCPKFVATSDLESAFLNVGLHPPDREFAKFIWTKNINEPFSADNTIFYRFTRIAFGVICSPYILAGVIHHHLNENGGELAKEILRNLYVDNLILASSSWEKLLEKCQNSKTIFQSAQMNLREFMSNSPQVIEALPIEDRLEKPMGKILGLLWNPSTDNIGFQWPKSASKMPITRRSVLSDLASIFDPLGLLGPAILPAKLFFQKLFDQGHDWDTPLSAEEKSEWKNYMKGWDVPEIFVPRRVLQDNNASHQLHAFVDASSTSYAAAIFIRSEINGKVTSNLIMSKNRLKPKNGGKTLTIPKMELIAILIGIRALKYVKKELDISIDSTYLWSDSQIALHWIKSTEIQPAFIQRRLVEIRSQFSLTFGYVRTDKNPADFITRGLQPSQLAKCSLWWHGPNWLLDDPEKWPNEMFFGIVPEQIEGAIAMPAKSAIIPSLNPIFNLKRFSSWERTVRTAVYLLRFIRRASRQTNQQLFMQISHSGKISAQDYNIGKIYLIRSEQFECLEELQKYQYFLDKNGIMRLKTRIINSRGPEGLINPILLPKFSELAKFIVIKIHNSLCHVGVENTLVEFLNEYWMPQARKFVRIQIKRCLKCSRQNSPNFALPIMPPLPTSRVTQHRPFESIGLDYAGPTLIKVEGSSIKSWIALFCCLSTRAIHLDFVLGLTTKSFINTLRRFILRRGCPTEILSDNASTFVLANETLQAFIKNGEEGTNELFLADYNINWHFIPQLSPWAGGCYERLIAMVKDCFKRTLGRSLLNLDDFHTLLCEIEGALNSRPLTYTSDSENSLLPLRPIDFIQPFSKVCLNPTDVDYDELEKLPPHEKLIAWWKGTLTALDHFWARWKREYLVHLRDKSKWHHKQGRLQLKSCPMVGEVVLVEDTGHPKNTWNMARIVELNGIPPLVRSVKLKLTNNRIITRPVNKIYSLELEKREIDPPTPDIDISNPLAQPSIEEGGTAADDAAENDAMEKSIPLNTPIHPPPIHTIQKKMANNPPQNIHKMATRSKSKTVIQSTAINMTTFISLIFFVFISIQSTMAFDLHKLHRFNCTGCLIHCNQNGVNILAPAKVEKYEICCQDFCQVRPANPDYLMQLPPETLITDFKCSGKFWAKDIKGPMEVNVQCNALEPCQLVQCTFCTELLLNPTCDPKSALILYAIGLFIFFIFSAILCTICQAFLLPISILRQILKTPISLFCPCGRYWKRKAKKSVTKVKDKVKSAKQALTGDWRQATLARYSHYAGTTAIIICILALAIPANSETISVISRSKTCKEISGSQKICTVNFANTLTLLPASMPSKLLFESDDGKPMGGIQITLNSLKYECQATTIAWLRSYQIQTKSIWLCPSSGSCSGSICSSLGKNDKIQELEHYMDNTGVSGCLQSSAAWTVDCALPSASCYFYRWFAQPISDQHMELFNCANWEAHIYAEIEIFDAEGGNVTSAILHPGHTFHLDNISITPLAVTDLSQSSPILHSKFITDGFSVAFANDVPTDLKCPTEQDAIDFNCEIDQNACADCTASVETVHCQCREFYGENILNDPQTVLPINIGPFKFKHNDFKLFIEKEFTPIQLHVIANQEIILHSGNEICLVEIVKITGCSKCLVGAKITYKCHTNNGKELAEISCPSMGNFVMKCSPNSTEQNLHLFINSAIIHENCTAKCPGGTTTFNLEGKLAIIPVSKPIQENIIESEQSGQSLGFYNPFIDDLIQFGGNMVTAISNSIQFIKSILDSPFYLLLMLLVGLFILFIILRFKYVLWRKAMFFLPLLFFSPTAAMGNHTYNCPAQSLSVNFFVSDIHPCPRYIGQLGWAFKIGTGLHTSVHSFDKSGVKKLSGIPSTHFIDYQKFIMSDDNLIELATDISSSSSSSSSSTDDDEIDDTITKIPLSPSQTTEQLHDPRKGTNKCRHPKRPKWAKKWTKKYLKASPQDRELLLQQVDQEHEPSDIPDCPQSPDAAIPALSNIIPPITSGQIASSSSSVSSTNAPPAKRQKSLQQMPVRDQANILHSALMRETPTRDCEIERREKYGGRPPGKSPSKIIGVAGQTLNEAILKNAIEETAKARRVEEEENIKRKAAINKHFAKNVIKSAEIDIKDKQNKAIPVEGKQLKIPPIDIKTCADISPSTEDFDISPNDRLSPTSADLLGLRRQAFRMVDTTTAALWERARHRKEKEGKDAH